MAKNIVYFGELDLFSETIKKMAKIEGLNFYDFPSWEECGEQLTSLEANFIFIDLDSIDTSILPDELQQYIGIFFRADEKTTIKWQSEHSYHQKPLDVLQFREFLKGLLDG